MMFSMTTTVSKLILVVPVSIYYHATHLMKTIYSASINIRIKKLTIHLYNAFNGKMIRPGFLSNSERKQLTAYTRSQCEDHGVACRANAILLLDDGENCVQIAKFLYLDDDTIRNWYNCYRRNGWKESQSRMTSAQEADR